MKTTSIRLLTIVFFALALPISLVFAQDSAGFNAWNLDEYESMTGNSITEFAESPMLADFGLPALTERLPEDILVVQPLEGNGQHGGTLTGYGLNPVNFGNDLFTIREQRFIGLYPDWQAFYPNVIKSYTVSDDATVLTVDMRVGLKWSDGELFTADDVMFWYTDILHNTELTPDLPSEWTAGGAPIVVNKLDDYQLEFVSEVPNPIIIETLTLNNSFAPKHFLQQWHTTYNEDAVSLAESEGYPTWVEAFTFHSAIEGGFYAPDGVEDANLPSLDAWTFDSVDEFGNRFYTRNPYYWKVDTDGNQLPYIDSQIRLLVEDAETAILKIRAGEIDIATTGLTLEDVPILKDGEDSGNYRTLLWAGARGSERRYAFNMNYQEDPVLHDIFNDVRFRQAMSVAINRDEINQTLFFGLATPRQFTVSAPATYYQDWMGEYYAEYDPEMAKTLLMDMGLEFDEESGFFLRPDGEILSIIMEDATNNTSMNELIKEYWENIGVQATINVIARELFTERSQANQVQVGVWFGGTSSEFNVHSRPFNFRPPWGLDTVPLSGLLWRQCELSAGEEGETPPEDIIRLYDLLDEFLQTPVGTDRYLELGEEILTINVEGLYQLGTVGMSPLPVVAQNSLRNVPENAPWIEFFRAAQGDTWYWDN